MGKGICQVFTPKELVGEMLDGVGYTTQLYGKRILENSCGEGAFLGEIVTRYIIDGQKRGFPTEQIKKGLELDICGIEKDRNCYKKCESYLSKIACSYGINNVKWNLKRADALRNIQHEKYDYVVGNPPYITYYNLPEKERKYIVGHFGTCKKGKPDYYYAFTEAAICSLKKGGKLVYLIPNNFMKNRFSQELRDFLAPHVEIMIDYRNCKLFKDYLTSSVILICEKDSGKMFFEYIDIPNQKRLSIEKNRLKGKWAFYLPNVTEGIRFGDLFQVSAPVATLLNDAFVLSNIKKEDDKYVEVQGMLLEKKLLRSAASPKTKRNSEGKTYIIFPYKYIGDNRLSYKEEELKKEFPSVYAYLVQFKNRLRKRKSDKKSQWFEYGRTQALAHINQEKILLSTLITDRVRYYKLNKEDVPFSGMYIIPKGDNTLEDAERILSSADFMEYVKEIGISVSGSSFRISPRDVEDYIVKGVQEEADANCFFGRGKSS